MGSSEGSCDRLGGNHLALYVNRFLVETTDFLQKFSLACDTKLEGVARRIHQMESSLAILEAKLGNFHLKSSHAGLQSSPRF